MPRDPLISARAGVHTHSLDLKFQARLKDYESAALTGSYTELERARDFAMGAAEECLDARYGQALVLLRDWGIDPETRAR